MKVKSYNLKIKKIYVALGSTIEHDKWTSYSQNEKFAEFIKPEGLVYYEVKSIKEASKLVKRFIEYFKLSSSNWIGGRICDENFKFIANVSFNGKIWDNEDWRISNEIIL